MHIHYGLYSNTHSQFVHRICISQEL